MCPPQGPVLPSAPAVYFGASTLSVVPNGFNAQAFAAPPRNLNEADLQALQRLLQNLGSPPYGTAPTGTPPSCNSPTGSAPPAAGCSAMGVAPGAGAPTGYGQSQAPVAQDQRSALVQAELDRLRERIQEHTKTLAEIISRDPALMKKFLVDP
jgi:hypothetical protein